MSIPKQTILRIFRSVSKIKVQSSYWKLASSCISLLYFEIQITLYPGLYSLLLCSPQIGAAPLRIWRQWQDGVGGAKKKYWQHESDGEQFVGGMTAPPSRVSY